MKKDFLTIDDQIKLLSDRGLNINPVVNSRKRLNSISYYTLINGYGSPFLFIDSPKKYKNGATLEEIYSLYDFDTKLRHILLTYLLEIETRIKAQCIYAYMNDKDSNDNFIHDARSYTDYRTYDCSSKKKTNKIKSFINDLNNKIIKLSTSDSFKHYKDKYGYIPLWVTATRMSFGSLSKFYEALLQRERMEVARQYNLMDSDLEMMLAILTSMRNTAAHGDRIYCFKCPRTLPYLKKQPWSNTILKGSRVYSHFSDVVVCFKILLPSKAFKSFKNSLKNEIKILKDKCVSLDPDFIYKSLHLPLDWEKIFG